MTSHPSAQASHFNHGAGKGNGPAIAARELTRKFGDFVAVRSVNFTIEPGSIFGLLGPNGSGKSTIIRMLCGLIQPTSGTAVLDGIDVSRQPEAVKDRIGYTSQRFGLYQDLTVKENIHFFGRVYGLSGSHLRERRESVEEMIGIGPFADRLAGDLSGGWKQRLSVACALLHEPRILFLDEPTAGIDPVARRELWDLLFLLSSQGTTLFVTTHYMDEAERCSQVGYLFHSELLVCGDTEDLKEMEEVTPRGTKRLEVECKESSQALDALLHLEGVSDATLFGQSIHLLVDEGLSEELIGKKLEQKGFRILGIRPIEPSLEDVFVMLTKMKAR